MIREVQLKKKSPVMLADSQVPGPNIMSDMGKQARGRGLDDEGGGEEEADGQRQTRSEAVGNPKDPGKQQARKKVQQRKSDGEDAQDPDFKAKAW
ncbi:hypothetical protein PAXRUDRAFT_19758 [Paxillus rubicundulus Ve08.2h10]|uniref:Uncharacterized protein n=1 Tax=Paxillus rubicundulus Ve08.2h10 TaxID=930991 RepID=A0A0D0CU12_9AGAM|nr:hypothetical protein PAXRUDRAFT_19758 [Paxillus rubicundulus Ve08.2h10]